MKRKKLQRINFDMKAFKKVYKIKDIRKLRRMAYYAFSAKWIEFCKQKGYGV